MVRVNLMPAPNTIPHVPVKSSAIVSMGHDPLTQTLEVTRPDGSTYRYSGVSASEHQSILAAPSKGRALNALLARRRLSGTKV